MELITYLDNVVYDNPQNWEGVDTVLKRDREFDGVLAYYDATVTFYGDAYDYLLAKKDEGFCSTAEMVVMRTDGYTPKKVAQGTIFIADCEFKEGERSVLCKIKDSTFYAKINTNKAIKTVPSGNVSKNGSTITPAIPYDILMYALDGTTPIKTIYSIRVYEAFKWFIAFMTNNTITFRSDAFDYGGEYEGLAITCGAKLSNPNIAVYDTSNPPLPAFSFEELYKEVKKQIPICFVIEQPFTNPVFRLEPISYLDGVLSDVEFTDIDEILTKFDTQRLYSAIKVGSDTLNDSTFLSFPENIKYAGFKQEEFFTVGECSINNVLDLVNNWIISSNVIEASLDGDTDNNSNLILIDTLVTDPDAHDGRSTNTDLLSVGIYYYNELFTNYNKINRNNGGFPTSLAENSNNGVSGTFQAVPSANISLTDDTLVDTIFDAETYDNGGNYDTALYKFTAPSTNVYNFEAQTVIRFDTLTPPPFGANTVFVTLRIRVYDALNVLKQFRTLDSAIISSMGLKTLSGMRAIIMNETDYAIGSLEFTFNGGYTGEILVQNTYFRSDSNGDTSGLIDVVDSDEVDVQIHEFAYPLTADEFDAIIDSPIDYFTFYRDDNFQRVGKIEESKYNYVTGVATFKLSTNKNNNGI